MHAAEVEGKIAMLDAADERPYRRSSFAWADTDLSVLRITNIVSFDAAELIVKLRRFNTETGNNEGARTRIESPFQRQRFSLVS